MADGTQNIFDQFDADTDAGRASTPSVSVTDYLTPKRPASSSANPFDQFDNDPDSAHQTGGAGWADDLVSGMSVDNARNGAKALTDAQRQGLKITPKSGAEDALTGVTDPEKRKQASFWASFEHGLGHDNALAYADTLDHLALMSDDPSYQKMYKRWAEGIRQSFNDDDSSYDAVFHSFRDIHGISDAWGYIKEAAGRNIGVMTPSLVGGAALGYGGGKLGGAVGGKTGERVGALTGAIAGATLGNVHLQISDMRNALMQEGIEGEQLAAWTNYGAAVLTSLDSVFPTLIALKTTHAVRERVASTIAQRLIQGGVLRTPAEFVRRWGAEVLKDATTEVVTELAQQGITDFVPKAVAGHPITSADVNKFMTETAPEVVLQTLITSGAVTAIPSARRAYGEIREGRELARKGMILPGDRADLAGTNLETGQEILNPNQAQVILDAMELPKAEVRAQGVETAPPPEEAAGSKAVDVIQFVRNLGGIQPSGELDALDAKRYPGLVSRSGLDADKVREAMVEAGYFAESGPDHPAVTTPQDVFDAIGRAMSGERVVPIADREADSRFFANKATKEAEALLTDMEQTRVLPELTRLENEDQAAGISEVYSRLDKSMRDEVIERHVRGNENLDDLIEEMTIRAGNPDDIAALAVRYGFKEDDVRKVRDFVESPKTQREAARALRTVGGLLMAAQVQSRRVEAEARTQAANYHPGALTYGELTGMPVTQLREQAARVGVEIPASLTKEGAIKMVREAYGNPPISPSAVQVTPEEIGRAVVAERTMQPEQLAEQLQLVRNSAREGGEMGAAMWRQEGERLAARATQMTKEDAIRTATAFLGRPLTAEERSSRANVADAMAREFDNKLAQPVATSAPLPTTLPGGEEVALTPLAQARYQRLRAAVERAVATVLPDAVKRRVVERIDLQGKMNDARFALARVARNLPVTGDRQTFLSAKEGKTYWIEKEPGDSPGDVQFTLWSDERPELGSIGTVSMIFRGLGDQAIHGHTRPRYEVDDLRISNKDFRGRGIASAAYDHIEKMLGIKMEPSGVLLADGYEFWKRRDANSVQHHQWSEREQSWVSPTYVRRNIKFYESLLARRQEIAERPHRQAINESLNAINSRYAEATGWPAEIFSQGSVEEIAKVLEVSPDWVRATDSPQIQALAKTSPRQAREAAARALMQAQRSAEDYVQARVEGENRGYNSALIHFKSLWSRVPKDIRRQESLDRMFLLAGRNAAHAPLGSLGVAEKMEQRGTPAASIWTRTGWARGEDGKWRFEISDADARVKNWEGLTTKTTINQRVLPRNLAQRLLGRAPQIETDISTNKRIGERQINIPLPDFLHHPKLFEAYPFLRQMRVNFEYNARLIGGLGKGAMVSRKVGQTTKYYPFEVTAGSPEDAVSTVLHEIQHYIQRREGFATGSDQSMTAAQLANKPVEFEKPGRPQTRHKPPLYDAHYYYAAGQEQFWRTRRSMFDGAPHVETQAEFLLKLYDQEKTGEDVAADIERHEILLEQSLRVPAQAYLASFGEYEAYKVEQRRLMSAEERAQSYPFADQGEMPFKLVASKFQTRNYQDAYDEIMRRAQINRDIKARWRTREDIGNGVSTVRYHEDNALFYDQAAQPTKGELDQVPYDGLTELAKDQGVPGNAMVHAEFYPFVGGAELSLSDGFLGLPYERQRDIMDVVARNIRQRNMRPNASGLGDRKVFEFWRRYDPTQVAFDPRLYREQLQERAVAEYGPDAKVVFDGDYMPGYREALDRGEVWDLDEAYAYVTTSPREMTAAEQAEIKELRARADDMRALYHSEEGQTEHIHAVRQAERRINEITMEVNGWPRPLETDGIVPHYSSYTGQDGGVDDELSYRVAAEEALSRLGIDGDRRLSAVRLPNQLDPLGFYSRALEGARNMKQKSGTPEAMLNQLKRAGVDSTEIEATGLREFLAGKKQVTRDELIEHLTLAREPLRESYYGGPQSAEVGDIRAQLEALSQQVARGEIGPNEEENLRDPLIERLREAERRDPRLGAGLADRSIEPYNPTYTENVIYLPSKYGEVVRVGDVRGLMPTNMRDVPDTHYAIVLPDGKLARNDVGVFTTADLQDAHKTLRRGRDTKNEYLQEGHWQEPNVVGWYRGQMLRIEGEDGLVFNGDEIQSDWGQDWRNQHDKAKRDEQLRATKARLDDRLANGDSFLARVYRMIRDDESASVADEALESGHLTTGHSIFGSDYYGFEPKIREMFLAENSRAREAAEALAEAQRQVGLLWELGRGDEVEGTLPFRQTEEAQRELMSEYDRAMRADETGLLHTEFQLQQLRSNDKVKNVPDHPLVRSTSQWAGLVAKRLIREAVMRGAKGISLTPGFAQNIRWGKAARPSSAQVYVEGGGRTVAFFQKGRNGEEYAVGQLVLDSDGRITRSNLTYVPVKRTPQLLSDVMSAGADRIMSAPAGTPGDRTTRIELEPMTELGGKAFRDTYDVLYPLILQKLIRQFDPSIKQETRMLRPLNGTPGTAQEVAWSVFQKPWVYFPITDKVREGVMREGQPVYSVARTPEMVDPQSENRLMALGQTDPHAGIISIAMQAVEALAQQTGRPAEEIAGHVARHEAIEFFHGLGIFTDSEWNLLLRTAKKEGWVTPELRKAYTELYANSMTSDELKETILKEAIAEKFGSFLRDEAVAGAPRKPGQIVLDLRIGELFGRLKDFIEKIVNSVRGMGFQNWEQIFTHIERGEFAQRYNEAVGRTSQNLTSEVAGVVRAGDLPDARGFQPTPGATHPVIGLAEIIHEFRRAIGLPLAQGRLDPGLARLARRRGARLYGQYNFGTGVARVAVANDFDTITHEGGHHMEARYGAPLQQLMVQNTGELDTLAQAIGYGTMDLREGFAEFFRKYVTNPQTAQAQAPGMFHDFESMLQRDDPNMLNQLHRMQEAYLAFLTGSPIDVKIANQTLLIGRDGAYSRFMQEAEQNGLVNTIGDRMHWLYYSTISRNHGWWMATKRLLDIVEQRTGNRIDIRAFENPTVLVRRLAHTTAWAQQDLKRGIALRGRPDGGGVSMHEVMRTAFGGTEQAQWNDQAMQRFGDYLISRRAVRLFVQHNPQLRQVVHQYIQAHPELQFLAPAIPQNIESELEYPPTLEPLTHHLQALIQHTAENPQFGQAAALYYDFNHDILQFLWEKGLLTKEQRDKLMIDNDYAPFQRDMSDRTLNEGIRASRRPEVNGPLANKYGVYRSIHGSMRDVINPMQSTVQFVYEMRLRAAFNEVLQSMDRLARRAGNGGGEIFERLPAYEARKHEVQIREALRSAARGAGLSDTDTVAMLATVESYLGPNSTAELFTQQQAGERGERVVWFYDNGKAVPARLADGSMGQMMFEAFTTLGRRSPDMWVKLLAYPATAVRWGVTNAWEFMFRNIFVDSIASTVNSPYARPFMTSIRGLREVLGGGEYYRLYNRYGGMMGGESVQSLSDQSIERDFEALRSQTEHIIRRPTSIWDFLKMVLNFGELSETATRVGIFRNAMISNMADGLSRYQAAYEAAHASHDVMDFSRHGSKTELLRRAIPFFNASIQGIDKYARTLTGANDHGNAIRTWLDYQFGGRQLTPHEQGALGQAAKAWFWSTAVMGGASWLFWMLGRDDDDLDDIPDRIRATHWMVSLNGVLHFIPKDLRTFLDLPDSAELKARLPKPFEIAWFANGVERALDAAYKGDESAGGRYLNDFWTILAPPNGIPALDLPYGYMHGKDDFSHRDIIPYWEDQLERADQYGPYTSESAKWLGKQVNVSPYYLDYLIRGLGSSVGRDAQTGYEFFHNWANGTGPEPGIEDYPIARRFLYNVARSSQSIGDFYDVYRNKEGVVDWFWDTFTQDARSYAAAKGSYKRRKEDLANPAAAQELYDRLSPDQKVYATLSVDFKGKDSEFRNLHPIENAAEGISVVNNLMKEVVSGYVKTDVKDEPIKLTPQQEHYLRNELGHIRRGLAQNALNILGVPGWANQPLADVDKRIDVVKAANEPVYEEMLRRLDKKHFLEMSHVKQVWPEVKSRVLADRENAALGDLVAGGEIRLH